MRLIILFALSLSLRPADAGESESSGSSTYKILAKWDHENYHFQQREIFSNGECEEEILLNWKKLNWIVVKKMFKRKCKIGLEISHYKAMLIVGSPAADLCIFSTKPDVFYYKDKGQWKQVTAEGTSGQVSEADVKDTEVELLADKINKCRTAYDLYLNNKINVAQEEREEQQRAQRAKEELHHLLDLEKTNHNKIIDDLAKQKTVLTEKYNDDCKKETNDPSTSEGTIHSKYKEYQSAVDQKIVAEKNRNEQALQDITNKFTQRMKTYEQNSSGLSEKFRQVESEFQTKYGSLTKENN